MTYCNAFLLERTRLLPGKLQTALQGLVLRVLNSSVGTVGLSPVHHLTSVSIKGVSCRCRFSTWILYLLNYLLPFLKTDGPVARTKAHHNDATPTSLLELAHCETSKNNGALLYFSHSRKAFHIHLCPSSQSTTSTHRFSAPESRTSIQLAPSGISSFLPPVRGMALGANGRSLGLAREPLMTASLATEAGYFA